MPHEHNCQLDVISFSDGSKFIYGDRCGRFSELGKEKANRATCPITRNQGGIFSGAAGEPLAGG
jgi:hypothetical protein